MKKVVLSLKQKVKAGHENDYGVIDGYKTIYTIKGGGYKKLCSKAKRLSKQLGRIYIDGMYFNACEVFEFGLAAVCVETYISLTKDKGRGVVCDYFEDGKHVNTIVDVADFYFEEERKKKEFSMKNILNKLQSLQKKSKVKSFEIDFRRDDEGDQYICVVLTMHDVTCINNFAFYSFRRVEENMKEYECLLDVLEGRKEKREEPSYYI